MADTFLLDPCLNIDLLLQKFFDPWIKLERDLAWQMFLTCT